MLRTLGRLIGRLCVGLLAACSVHAAEPVRPLPLDLTRDLPPAKVALGEMLFHDKRLSGDGQLSCASCHDLRAGGTLRRASYGGKQGERNPPTLFNVALDFRMYRDGRAASLEAQFDAVVTKTMKGRWADIVPALSADRPLVERFLAIYGTGPTQASVTDAVTAFERSLVTPNARFDRWLRGDAKAISAEELEGYALFKAYGCVACHQGVNVGGNMFQRFGILEPITASGLSDPGRYKITRNEADRFVFKVPGLRNVALTAPYLHDGSARTLRDAVDSMFRHQLGRMAPDRDVGRIVEFLHTLTGTYNDAPLDAPPPATHPSRH